MVDPVNGYLADSLVHNLGPIIKCKIGTDTKHHVVEILYKCNEKDKNNIGYYTFEFGPYK